MSNKNPYVQYAPFDVVLEPTMSFTSKASNFLSAAQKPSRSDYTQQSRRVLTGFALLGVIGFVIKLIALPLNTYIVPQ